MEDQGRRGGEMLDTDGHGGTVGWGAATQASAPPSYLYLMTGPSRGRGTLLRCFASTTTMHSSAV